jgi:hypothetical protein
MQNLAPFVFSDFKNDRIKPVSHSANGHELFWSVGSLIEPIRPGEPLPRLLEPYPTPGIRPEAPALSGIEAEAHLI